MTIKSIKHGKEKRAPITSQKVADHPFFGMLSSTEQSVQDQMEQLRGLALERIVERGMNDSREKRTISNQEMSRRIGSWRKQTGPGKPKR